MRLLLAFGWMSDQTNKNLILNVISDAVFFFLPILLAFNAAKKFRCNPMVAATVGILLSSGIYWTCD
jgi:PTS system beta-glucosides-specific IIC component